jgi:hypothetical protein
MFRFLKKRPVFPLAVLVFCTALYGQSAHATRQKTFHVSGTITRSGHPSRGYVTFEGASTISVTSGVGHYDADLPLGTWTATVTIPHEGATEDFRLSRPRLFRVTEPSNIVLDLFVRPGVMCDLHGEDLTPEQWDHAHAMCDGMQFFGVPSSDGAPFEVLVGGLDHRLCSPKGVTDAVCNREFATYNLLSVQADKIVYHSRERLLEASGNVVIKDGQLEYRRDSIRFLIGDGQAVPAY